MLPSSCLILVNVLICCALQSLHYVLGNVLSHQIKCLSTLSVHGGIVRNVFSIPLYVWCRGVIDNKADFDFDQGMERSGGEVQWLQDGSEPHSNATFRRTHDVHSGGYNVSDDMDAEVETVAMQTL